MSDCKIYPADTVDITGYVWPTVGENIRNAGFQGKEIKSIDIVIENGTIVNAPSFVVDDLKNGHIFFKHKNIVSEVCILTTAGTIWNRGNALTTSDGLVNINADKASGTIRVFYYDN